MQVAYICPSSKVLVKRVAKKMDFSKPRVIVEYGPGEGCHTREIVKRMHPDSTLILFEIDPELAAHLQHQFRHDPRISVLQEDAQNLPAELEKRGIPHCDYIVSGLPFSIINLNTKRILLEKTFACLAPTQESAFVIYQMTKELQAHAKNFPRLECEFCLQNIPPMFVMKFYKQALHGHTNGHKLNGSKRH
ncbi:MAG: rRNA adenine N-6-methyltransferase family protein [Verrucomicrobiota bacterium]